METTYITGLQSGFTDAIGDLSAPAIAILTAGIALTVLKVGYRFLRGVFKSSASA